jgi:hypothetical protein
MENIKKNTEYPEDQQIKSLIDFNNNLRKNIFLSLQIYKKINNFNHKYIHTLINDK